MSAQHNFFNYKLYTANEGLPSNRTGKLCYDKKGFLWIATMDGLSRYNGTTFENFHESAKQRSEGLLSSGISDIEELNDSTILIGTKSGLSVFNTLRNKFENSRIADSTFINNTNKGIHEILLLKDNQVLISSFSSLFIFDSTLKLIKHLILKLNNQNVNFLDADIFLDKDSSVVFFSSIHDYNFVGQLDLKTNMVSSFSKESDLLNALPVGLTMSYRSSFNDAILASSFGKGLYYFDLKKKEALHFELGKPGKGNFVKCFASDDLNKKLVWLATRDGLFQFNIQSKEIKKFDLSNYQQIEDAFELENIVFDKNGTMWLASTKGLIKIPLLFRVFGDKVFVNPYPGNHFGINKIIPRIHEGLALFTYGGGIFLTDSNLQITNKKKTADISYVYDAVEYGANYYVATNEGLFLVDKTTLSVKENIYLPDTLKRKLIASVLIDRKKNLWVGIGSGYGLYRYNLETKESQFFNHYIYPSSSNNYLPIRHPSIITEAANGDIYMGYNQGGKLIKWGYLSNSFEEINIVVNNTNYDYFQLNQVDVDSRNNIWISTFNLGIFKYNTQTNSFTRFSREFGMLSDVSVGFSMSKYYLLSLSDQGMSSINLNNNQIKTFDISGALPLSNIDFLFHSKGISKQYIYMGDFGDIYKIEESTLMHTPKTAALYLQNVTVQNQKIDFLSTHDFRYYQTNFSFEFIGVNLLNGIFNEYAYKLSGVNTDWVNCKNSRQINFAALAPGNYSFEVKVKVANGDWSKPITYLFFIATPFWQTWWFYAVCIVITAFIIYAFLRYRINQLQKIQRFQQRISSDLHDDIGASLTSINILSQLSQQQKIDANTLNEYLHKINEQTTEVTEALRDIVWSINPKNDKLDIILARMKRYTAELLEPLNISCNFNTNITSTSESLHADIRQNLYLIFKEAVNNLAKYSGATEALIIVNKNAGHLHLQIKDNGTGFNPQQVAKGNGLENMQRRAKAMHAQFKLLSAPGKGTNIEVDITL